MLVNGMNPLRRFAETGFSGTRENRFNHLFAQGEQSSQYADSGILYAIVSGFNDSRNELFPPELHQIICRLSGRIFLSSIRIELMDFVGKVSAS